MSRLDDHGYMRMGEVGHTDAHPWLFPSGAPGHPVSTVTLRHRLHHLGIKPRAARNGTLMNIAAQVPAVVISDLLGITNTTATNWTSARQDAPATPTQQS